RSRTSASSSARALMAAAAVMHDPLVVGGTAVRPYVPVLAPDSRAEGLLVREAAGSRVARQVVRDRRAAPLSEVPLDGGLPGADAIGGCRRPRLARPLGP